MKKLLFLILFAFAATAQADWVKMGEIDGGTFYIDTATILSVGARRDVWELTDLKEREEGSELSRRSRVAYDCERRLTKVLSLSTYMEPMATGRMLLSVEREGLWKEVPPNTAFETSFKAVCAN